MKLAVAVVHDHDTHRVCDALVARGVRFTKIGSTGGFLREGNTTLLIGTDTEGLDTVLDIIHTNCQTREQYINMMQPDSTAIGVFLPSPVKVQVGGAVVFVLDIERLERY